MFFVKRKNCEIIVSKGLMATFPRPTRRDVVRCIQVCRNWTSTWFVYWYDDAIVGVAVGTKLTSFVLIDLLSFGTIGISYQY